jgi:hypothetical protein
LDGRWDQLVSNHPKASIFHQRGWLQALSDTYGYEPVVLTRAEAAQPLREGIVFCGVSSWITGTRLVSLPFADHCEPLLDDLRDSDDFLDWLRKECDRQHWRYIELRPVSLSETVREQWHSGRSYWFHRLDLGPTLERIFQGFHRDSIQRRIRRAEGEQLSYEVGQSQLLVDAFYGLLLKTRRRHKLLPQPRAWFSNLVRYLGDKVVIRLARKNGTPIAVLLTLRHGATVVYKYGCSDERFHHLAGMPFLFWKLIEESKAAGAEEIDFGRSDLDNEGLITFKDRFGTTRRSLIYLRYPKTETGKSMMSWGLRPMQHLIPILPDAFLPAAGGVLYRHMG